MPHATLVALTSPVLLGQAPIPPAALPEPPVAIAAAQGDVAAESVLWLEWSLLQQEDDQEQSGSEQTPGNEIVVEGEIGPVEGDPMGALNEQTFEVMQDVDRAFVAPLAFAYEDALPGPVRQGLQNFIRNLGEPVNALNFLLQFKIGKAFETLGRFALNSTFGLGGVIDLAEKRAINLPYRRNGFANTLGFYGVGQGPYFFLPLAGSTTLRDGIGNALDNSLLPLVVGGPFGRPEFGIPIFVVSSLQSRIEIDEKLQRINASPNPYATQRDGYLAEREAEIEEFRVGSPLQGIPDRDRDPEDRNDRIPDDDIDAEIEADEAANEAAISSLFTQPVIATFDPSQLAITRWREPGDRRYSR